MKTIFHKSVFGLALLVCAMAGLTQTANAGPLTGETVNATHHYPSIGAVNNNMGDQVVPTGAFDYFGLYTIVVDGDSITYDSSGNNSTWSGGSFNGPIISILTSATFSSVTIDPSTNYAGFTASRLTFTDKEVRLNLNSLQVVGFIKLNLGGGTPVPVPGALLLLGFGLIGLGVRRRAP